MIDILILAVISAVILYKLYTMLGQDDSEDIAFKFSHSEFDQAKDITPAGYKHPNANADRLNYASIDPNSKLSPIIKDIRSLDPYFTDEAFLNGAKKAFEMIIKAFSKGDKLTLQSLLEHEVYDEFASSIDVRQKEKQYPETTLVSIISVEIISAFMKNSLVDITVKFVTEQINIIRNQEGKIISGNPSHINHIEDVWTFARDVKSYDPTWKLIATNVAV